MTWFHISLWGLVLTLVSGNAVTFCGTYKQLFQELRTEKTLKKQLSDYQEIIRDFGDIIAPEDLQQFVVKSKKIRDSL